MEKFNLNSIDLPKFLFFTGKGGVGKTSIACSTAVGLADKGKSVLLISTDPASNLQDVFRTEINDKGTDVGVKNLTVVNIDPMQAAAEYRESVVAGYRGIMPEEVIKNMTEQLSGSCTVEIATFNEFTRFLADEGVERKYDYIVFDTAPTGHTLRLLQLPSAWTGFISESTHGASCLGQLSGLEDKKAIYKKAVETLADGAKTLVLLVARPDNASLKEANRAKKELSDLKIDNTLLIVNGVIENVDDDISEKLKEKQFAALKETERKAFYLPLRSYSPVGIENIRAFFDKDKQPENLAASISTEPLPLNWLIEEMVSSDKKVIFTMGKGGVGKTTLAATIAVGLADKGKKVFLATTDSAHHIENVLSSYSGIKTGYIDEKKELEKYRAEVLSDARKTMSDDDIAYIEEDLRSPCTQEIAVFRAFAKIVEKADDEIVVIDTAPSGHTLLLLDSTQSYHREVERMQGGTVPESVKRLLPRLRNKNETEVIIVTLAEATPVYEAMRLEEDLLRAGLSVGWWIINSSMYKVHPTGRFLSEKANAEVEWINKVGSHANGRFSLVGWQKDNLKDGGLKKLLSE